LVKRAEFYFGRGGLSSNASGDTTLLTRLTCRSVPQSLLCYGLIASTMSSRPTRSARRALSSSINTTTTNGVPCQLPGVPARNHVTDVSPSLALPRYDQKLSPF